ncbi:hypothetical protein V8D89_003679 [Ganoderma adspersum]
MIVFVLSQRPADSDSPSASQVNPASVFVLERINNQDGEHVPQFHKLASDAFGSGCVEGGFRGDAVDPDPAGLVPVLCIVEGASTPLLLQYPVYHPSRHPDHAADKKTVGFCQDITRRIFIGFVNTGIVIRAPAEGQTSTPPSGIMVRALKGWRWQQAQKVWQFLDVAMPHQNPPLCTTGSATDLWMRFQRW